MTASEAKARLEEIEKRVMPQVLAASTNEPLAAIATDVVFKLLSLLGDVMIHLEATEKSIVQLMEEGEQMRLALAKIENHEWTPLLMRRQWLEPKQPALVAALDGGSLTLECPGEGGEGERRP